MDVKDLTEKEFVGQIGRPAVTQKKTNQQASFTSVKERFRQKYKKKRAVHMHIR